MIWPYMQVTLIITSKSAEKLHCFEDYVQIVKYYMYLYNRVGIIARMALWQDALSHYMQRQNITYVILNLVYILSICIGFQ